MNASLQNQSHQQDQTVMDSMGEEQRMLRDAARAWVRKKSPVTAFRTLRDSGSPLGYDPDSWREIAEMGWTGVIIPEEYGGANMGYRSLGMILEELGRTLTATPLLACGLAASALMLGGSSAQKAAWLPGIAAGEVIGAIAVDEGPRHAPDRIGTTFSDGRITGHKTLVLEGQSADLLVVSALAPDGVGLFMVRGDDPLVMRQRLALIDSRGAANIDFNGASAEPLSGGREMLDRLLDHARSALAAEMLGGATQAFEITLDYLKTRVQFGQLIGSFQALQHRAARMLTELEMSRSAVEAALAAIDDDSPEIAELASAAKAKMGDTFHLVSNEMIQMHGGIGMTDAHDAGLYLKRARAAEAAYGNRAFHRDRYATLRGY